MGYVRQAYDSLRNLITGLGQLGIDPNVATQYYLSLLDRNTLENLYRGDWLARKIVNAPAKDMTREWRAWQANQAQIEAIEAVEKTLDIKRKTKDWLTKARLYGGAALVIGVDDGNDPSEPIDLDRCKKGCLKYVVVLHRYELNAGPRIYNVNDPYYTRPAYYTVSTPMFGFAGEMGVTSPGTNAVPGALNQNVVALKRSAQTMMSNVSMPPVVVGMTQIHPSRVLEMPGNELPDWRLAQMGAGWGDSVLQTVVDTMAQFTQINQSIAAMVNDGKLDIIKIPEFANRVTNQEYKDRLLSRFAMSAQSKSVISALLLDREEEWERVATQYGGLPMILHEFITVVSAAAEIPVSVLFGQATGRGLQSGTTSGGEDDRANYFDNCAQDQKNEMSPRMGMLDQCLMRSALGYEDPNIHYEWNPLWQMKAEDKAKMALTKAQATQIYVSLGIVNEDALREGVVNQLIEDGTYPGLDDAIEQFGAEPEMPDDDGGFMPGRGTQGPQTPPEPEPGPEDVDHSGPVGG